MLKHWIIKNLPTYKMNLKHKDKGKSTRSSMALKMGQILGVIAAEELEDLDEEKICTSH